MLGLLDAASEPAARLTSAVYRASAPLHRDVTAGVRRQMPALDAARYGDRELAARITAMPVDGEPAARWIVEWATGSQVEPGFGHPLTGHTDEVNAVATVEIDGRPHAVTGSWDGTVRVWDPAAGEQVGGPLTGHDGWVTAVATVEIDGRPHAVTGGEDGTIRVWDVVTGEKVGKILPGGDGLEGSVAALTTVKIDGRPHVVTSTGDGDGGAPFYGAGSVWVWDLTTGKQIGEPLTGEEDGLVTALTTVKIDGLPHAVINSGDCEIRVWDLPTGTQVGREFVFPAEVNSVAVATSGRLVVGFGHEVALLAWR